MRLSAQVGFQVAVLRTLHVKRLKQGLSTTHPLRGDELRVLRAWLAERTKMNPETKALFGFLRPQVEPENIGNLQSSLVGEV